MIFIVARRFKFSNEFQSRAIAKITNPAHVFVCAVRIAGRCALAWEASYSGPSVQPMLLTRQEGHDEFWRASTRDAAYLNGD
jgi:hypothetical protein